MQAAGFEVFRDVIGLRPGDVWSQKLEFELDSSDAVVLIVSEKVRTSKWVHNEISMAEEIGLPVIPIFAEKVRSPLWLRHLQALDFCVQVNWVLLIDALVGRLSLPSPPSPLSCQTVEVGASDLLSIPSTSGRGVGVRAKPDWASTFGTDQYGIYADLAFKSVVQRFRYIEAGAFWMGAPNDEKGRYEDEVLHKVTLSKAFWLADTTCTQALWHAVMGNNPAHFKGNQNPVEQVSWQDAQSFTRKLTRQVDNLSVRLPTEAEWEYVCRAGTSAPFSFGETISVQQVNFNNYLGKTALVKSYPANSWGLYEMHGNVWEWCEDCYAEYSEQAVIDPCGAPVNSYRILRGGFWLSISGDCRCSIRRGDDVSERDSTNGFRFILSHSS